MSRHGLVSRYMHGRCLDMASALGRATGLPVVRLRTRDGSLAHAFVVLDRHLPRRSWRCVDVSGTMPLAAVRSNVEAAFGSTSVSRDETPATVRGVDDAQVLEHASILPHLVELLATHVPLSPDVPPVGYPPMLGDARAIARHVVDLSPDEVDGRMVEDAYVGSRARLVWVPMQDLIPGPPDANVPRISRERAYARMHVGSTPPILVDDGIIKDGHHRHRVAIARGDAGMWCYVIEEESQG